jgi:hypothetical protein
MLHEGEDLHAVCVYPYGDLPRKVTTYTHVARACHVTIQPGPSSPPVTMPLTELRSIVVVLPPHSNPCLDEYSMSSL